MNNKIKALLLSALVFPGTGQFVLKRYHLGGILASVALISLGVILVSTVKQSLRIAEKIQAGDIPLDVIAISNQILEQPANTDGFLISTAWISLIIAWLISIIDSLRMAK